MGYTQRPQTIVRDVQGTAQRELLGTDWFRLRGQLFRSIVETISGPEDLERIVEDPEKAYEFAVEEYRENPR